MNFGPRMKEQSRETQLFTRRVIVGVVGMLVLIGVLIVRLVYLQLLSHDHYTTLSLENRLRVLPIAPTRGLVYSRDGVLLADNRTSFMLEVVPEKVEDLEQAIGRLRQFITLDDDQLARFRSELAQRRRFDTIPLKNNLTEQEVAVFSVNRQHFPGFNIAGRLSRYYPLGSQTAALVGYVGRINEAELKSIDPAAYAGTTHIGKEGIEKSYENVLHGTAGYQQVEVNAEGRVLRVVERSPPIPGRDLHLSLDTRLQAAAIDSLQGHKGAIVALEPATGAVLAFVSNPSFDPNEFVNGISTKLYQSLRDSPDRPLFNRALQGLYPPGSTIKPIMAAGGIETGLRQAGDRTWCPGFFRLPNVSHKYRCWQKAGHGSVDLVRSLAESCDVYYYALAKDLGIDRMHALLTDFGLGVTTGIDLPGELAGLVPSREWKQRARKQPWYPGETLVNGIGQGFMLTTPLQLAYAASIIANRGQKMSPRAVATIEDAAAGTREPVAGAHLGAVAVTRPEAWTAIVNGMHEVVQGARGTARATAVGATYQYAGKTGTAQLFGIKQNVTLKNEDIVKHLRDHALFIAFAPLEQPRLALGIIVENGESGSKAAAPIARALFDAWFRIEGAPDASG